ncbi:MAG: hypothetical protein IBJ10_06550 [Phycisphaerales bacterium]|nr:hypothetical protein [Phycisphaerales bacterium]
MGSFPKTQVRPVQLRSLLREAREHGEALIGWGAAETFPDAATATFQAALSMTPIVGAALGALVFRSRRCVLALTDQRLLVVGAERGGRGRLSRMSPDAWVGSLEVRRIDARRFAIRAEGEGGPFEVRLRVLRAQGRGVRRLMEALEALAEPGD